MQIETKCIHEGWIPSNGQPRSLPIVQSTTFKYDSSNEMAKLFDLECSGYFYSRLQNPTNDYVADKISKLEGGIGGILTSSGQAANFFAIINICENGDSFLSSNTIYGGTYNLFISSLKKFGIECILYDPNDSIETIEKLIKSNTKAIFGETISNPTVSIFDISKMATIAHNNNIPLIIDNTFPTPINCRPIEWGADIITHSTTKYIDGHGSTVGGCIIDSGNFDFSKYPNKFPGLNFPDPSYHGITYAKKFGKLCYLTKITSHLMRDYGAIQSPFNSYLINLGLETLALRMKQHCKNAKKVANYLINHPKIEWVHYSDLETDSYHTLQKKYCPKGSCGVIAFGIKGNKQDTIKFMDSLKLISIVTHVADTKSCILHPASHTHRQLSSQELKDAGIDEKLIRLSVGIENIEDIIEDLDQALNAI